MDFLKKAKDALTGQASPLDITSEDTKLYSFLKEKVTDTRRMTSRTTQEAQWLTNVSYLLGYSDIHFDPILRRYRSNSGTLPQLTKSRLHVNKILPTIQNRLSRLTKSRPKFQVRPNSNDQTDKDASRLSEQILDYVWQEEDMATKQIDLYMLLQECGHAYLKASWDTEKGEPMFDPETGELEFEGNIRVDVVSAFEVFPDPLAKSLKEAKWIIQAKVRKLDYFKERYEKGHLVKEEDLWLQSAQYEQRINEMNQAGSNIGGSPNNLKNVAIELSYYERRSKKHPNGRLIIGANGVVLEDKDLPIGDIPFCKFDDIVVGGKYYSESIITHLRPIQDQYNRLINKRAQWTNQMLTGKYLTARGSELIAEALNDESGEVVEYTPVPNAPAPTAMSTPAIPSYAYKEEDSLIGQFNDVSGINEVSRGQAPNGGITAAIALQYLSEQDDTRIGIMSRRHELQYAKFGNIILRYIEKYYTNDRLLKLTGSNNEYLVKSFKGADIRGNTDVVVVEGSTLPGSITAKRDLILTLRREGLLGDPADPKANQKVLKDLEYGNVDGVWEDYAIDMNQVKESIELIKQGIRPEISEFDNNELHFYEKNKLRKTNEFEKMSPESQRLLLEDINARVDLMTEMANPQLSQQDQQIAMQEEQLGALPTEEELLQGELEQQQNLSEVDQL